MLIKGDIVPQDLEKANKLAKKRQTSNNESKFALFFGKIRKKETKFDQAFKHFQKSNLGNAEAMHGTS